MKRIDEEIKKLNITQWEREIHRKVEYEGALQDLKVALYNREDINKEKLDKIISNLDIIIWNYMEETDDGTYWLDAMNGAIDELLEG